MDIYLQEAESLNLAATQDKDALFQRGLSPIYVSELSLRINACKYAQAIWFRERKTQLEAAEQWKDEGPKAFELRDLLVDEFDFAFHNNPTLLERVREIKDGGSNS